VTGTAALTPPRAGLRLIPLLASLTLAGVACGGPSEAELVQRQPWEVTVYYTAVESLHSDAPVQVRGCLDGDGCDHGQDLLGEYPRSFATAVRDEGTGRVTGGAHAGQYLNWSYDIGYWLDDAPRDAHGRPLEPFRSAAATGLPDDTALRLVDCGRLDSGDPVPRAVCDALRAGHWEVRDRFTPGVGGDRQIDLYIGEETGRHFTASGRLYVSLRDAAFRAGN